MHSVGALSRGQFSKLAAFPISYFAMVMGLCGLTIATAKIEALSGIASHISSALFLVSLAAFSGISMTYLRKAWRHPASVRAEWNDPVRISFFPTASISLILLGSAGQSVSLGLSQFLWTLGTASHMLLTISVMTMWIDRGKFAIDHATPAWFMPLVGNILVPISGVHFAHIDLCWLYFSVGLFFWPILLNIILYRLIFHHPLPGQLIPTLFILLAPPSAAFIAWVSMTGTVDAFARILYYSAVFFSFLLIPQLPKFFRQKFSLSWWAYSFPLAAFTIATLLMAEHSSNAVYAWAGQGLFALLAIVVLSLVVRTVSGTVRHEFCLPW